MRGEKVSGFDFPSAQRPWQAGQSRLAIAPEKIRLGDMTEITDVAHLPISEIIQTAKSVSDTYIHTSK